MRDCDAEPVEERVDVCEADRVPVAVTPCVDDPLWLADDELDGDEDREDVCVSERDCVCVRERVCVCVRERLCVCDAVIDLVFDAVCVCVCDAVSDGVNPCVALPLWLALLDCEADEVPDGVPLKLGLAEELGVFDSVRVPD